MKNQNTFDQSLLVIIDMQEAFRRPGLQWHCPGYDQAASNISQLRQAHSGQTVWTQFIRDPAEPGAWQAYYDRWDDYRIAPDSPLWSLTLDPDEDDTIIQAPTFGKWHTALSKIAEPYDHLTVAGVATDCCVLSTVLSAVDANKHVTIVADACAGATLHAHQQALHLMGMLAPMTSLATTNELTPP